MNTPHRLLTASFILAAALGITGCGSADTSDEVTVPPGVQVDPPPTTDGSEANPDENSPTEGELDEVTRAALAAIDLAERETGGVAYELSDDDDETKWEVDIAHGDRDIEVHVNWAGTEILRTEADDQVDDDTLAKLDVATITIREAITAAVPHTQGDGRIDEAELDEENGVVTWEVTFDDNSRDMKVYVDAVSGEVLKTERND